MTVQQPYHGPPVDAEKAAETFPEYSTTSSKAAVHYKYKDIYHSTPYHKEWAAVPRDLRVRTEPGNAGLVLEQLSLFLQALLGPAGLERDAASEVLSSLALGRQPENEPLAAIAMALDHVLASNGGRAATLTLARTETGFDFDRSVREPVYVRFQKDVADTNVTIPRYPDRPRTDARSWMTDLGVLRTARRIQARAAEPPVEIEVAFESYQPSNGELSIGVEIRDDPTLPDLYRKHGWSP